MKKLFAALISLLLFSQAVFADQWVNGYTRKDGTQVGGYYRSSPDSSYNNNWSVQGNQNPYTGSYGTNSPTWNDKTPSYNENTYGYPGYNSSGNNRRK